MATAPTSQVGWGNWVVSPVADSQLSKSDYEGFLSKIKPEMIGADGRFKAPAAGVNFALEGMTPQDVYSTLSQKAIRAHDDVGSATEGANRMLLDPTWRPGPDNGGGVLGGLARAVGNMATSVAKNPALMAAATAGLAPMVSGGLTSAGVSAGAAKIAAPMLINGAKTLATGGTLADAVRGAGMSYFGNQVGGAVSSAVGGDIGKFVGGVAGSVASGKSPVGAVVGGAFDLASSAFPNAGGFLPIGGEARSFISGMLPTIMGSTNSSNSLVRKPIPGSNLARLQSQYSTEALNELIASMQRPRSTSNGDWSDTFA